MKFTGEFVTGSINLARYQELLKEYLQEQLESVANVWLMAVTDKVPVWSGMSQGSLLELVELVNGTLIIRPKDSAPNRIAQGRALGSATPSYTNLADFNITIVTDVPHYNVQEFKNVGVSRSAPWHSLIAGKLAAERRMQTTKLILPTIKVKRIKI